MQLLGRGLVVSSLCLGSSALATDFYWLTPSSQIWHSSVFPNTTTPTWSDETGTITLGPPNSASADAYIIATGSPYLVTVTSNVLVHSLTLDAVGGGLQADGRTITGDIFANAGDLMLYNSTLNGNLNANGGAITLLSLSINGAINGLSGLGTTLTGTTTGIGAGLVVNSTSAPVILTNTLSGLYASSTGEGLRATGTVFFNNVTSNGRVNVLGTIYGVGAPNMIGGEIALTGGTLFNDTVAMTVNGAGLVHGYGSIGSSYGDRPVRFNGSKLSADVPGQTLSHFYGYVAMDGGTIEAKNGGIFQVAGGQLTGEGAGYTLDSAGGTALASNAIFSGLYAGSTGEGFQTSGNCYLNNAVINGRMKLLGAVYGVGAPNVIGGELSLAGGTLFNDTVAMTVGATGLVHGFGAIGSSYGDRPVRFNGSRLSADVNGQTLDHYYGYLAGNGAVLEATNGGTLALTGGQITGEGAGFTVNSVSGVVRSSGEIFTGLYAGSTGEGIRMTADSHLIDATVNGRFNLVSGALWGKGSANVVGGEINISGGNLFNYTGSMTVGPTGLVRGYGLIGSNFWDRPVRFVGSKLSADVSGQTLTHYYGYLAANGAVVEAKNGGTLNLAAGQLTGEGAGFTVNSVNGVVRASGEIFTGLYAGSTGEGIRVTLDSTLIDATANGRFKLVDSILWGRGSANTIGGEVAISGIGNLFNDTGTMTVGPTGLVHGAGFIGSNYADRPVRFVGSKLSADVNGQILNHYYGYLAGDGAVLEGKDGGILNLSAGQITGEGAGFTVNSVSGTVKAAGGTVSGLYAGSTGEGIRVTADSTLRDATANGRFNIVDSVLYCRGSANVIGGEVKINGAGNFFNDTGTLRVTANGIVHGAGLVGSNYSDRPIHIQGGLLSADVSGQTLSHYYGYVLLDGGTISSESGGTMAMNAVLSIISGTLKSNSAFTFVGPFTMPAGQMSGTGSFTTPTLTNAGGIVNPGDPIGSLTLNGNYVQQAGGTMRIDIDGYAPGQSDRFVVNGTANLGGELTVFTTGGFVPQFGDRFRIMTANSRTNRFDTIPATQWQMAYGSNFVDIIYIVSNNAVSYPLTMDVIEGDLFDGSVADLGVSDDGYAKVLCDSTTLLSRVEFTGVAPMATFSKLWFLAETSVVRPGIAEATLLYDYTLGRFVEVGGGLAAIDDSLSLRSITVNAMRFKGPGNQVRAQIAWSPINDEDPSQDGWLHYLDLVRWEAAP